MHLPLLDPTQHQFVEDEFGQSSELISDLGHGNDPVAVMLTCWEIGPAPTQISYARPGEIMLVQCPGGLLSDERDLAIDTFYQSVLFGMSHPTVKHLIVCGHTNCQTLRRLASRDSQGAFCRCREQLLEISRRCLATYVKQPDKNWLSSLIQETVLYELEHLRSQPSIRTPVENGSLKLHAWILDDSTASVAAFDPNSGQFQF